MYLWSEGSTLIPIVLTLMKRLNQLQVKLNTLILLGDCVEMWLEPNSMSPLTMQERLEKWKSSPTLTIFLSLVRKMAEEDDVRVFYIRGNHDHEMDAATAAELFGAKVEFIPGTLIYLVNSDDGQQYRIRFAHGHDWDIFNSYSVANICERPLGYYITRCAATAEEYMNETEKVSPIRTIETTLRRFKTKCTPIS